MLSYFFFHIHPYVFTGKFYDVWQLYLEWLCISAQLLNPNDEYMVFICITISLFLYV